MYARGRHYCGPGGTTLTLLSGKQLYKLSSAELRSISRHAQANTKLIYKGNEGENGRHTQTHTEKERKNRRGGTKKRRRGGTKTKRGFIVWMQLQPYLPYISCLRGK